MPTTATTCAGNPRQAIATAKMFVQAIAKLHAAHPSSCFEGPPHDPVQRHVQEISQLSFHRLLLENCVLLRSK